MCKLDISFSLNIVRHLKLASLIAELLQKLKVSTRRAPIILKQENAGNYEASLYKLALSLSLSPSPFTAYCNIAT